jgi:putative phage-type endonuclease
MEQRTPEWYKARLGCVTASEVKNVLMAKTTAGYQNYRAKLVLEILTGTQQDSFSSDAMNWGTEFEPIARQEYIMLTGNKVVEAGFIRHETMRAGASPDGEVNEDGLVEIKCPNTTTHFNTILTNKSPKEYYAQMQMQMWIENRQWCDFVSYDPRVPSSMQIFIVRVKRDDKFIEDMVQRIVEMNQEVDEMVNKLLSYKTQEA